MGTPYHKDRGKSSMQFPATTDDLATENRILLAPKTIGTQQIDDNRSASAYARKWDAKDEETKDRVRVLGMLQSEELSDEYTEEGQCQ